ncbi:hypothetical protein [Streptomyces sp. DT9]
MTDLSALSALSGDESGEPGVLTDSWDFDEDWLSDGPKLIVPVPAGSHVDASLVRRVIEGCRTAGADGVLVLTDGPGGPGASGRTRRTVAPGRAVAAVAGIGSPALLASCDRQGAVLFSGPGSALVAGTPRFLRGAVPEGVDGGRARFARYARTVAHRWPGLRSLARSLPPRHLAWSRSRDVPAGTGAARQLELMRGLTTGSVDAPDFARGWQAARRTSQDNGERLREPLLTAFGQVFSLLEDYSVDLDLKDADDLTDQELADAVREIMEYTEGF